MPAEIFDCDIRVSRGRSGKFVDMEHGTVKRLEWALAELEDGDTLVLTITAGLPVEPGA